MPGECVKGMDIIYEPETESPEVYSLVKRRGRSADTPSPVREGLLQGTQCCQGPEGTFYPP